MENHLLGATYALSAALAWAFAMIFFKVCGEKTQPLALNIFKNVVAVILLFLTLILCGELLGFTDERIGSIAGFTWHQIWILALSGFLGITVADTLFFYSLNIIGVGMTAILDCLYSPSVVLFSWLLLAEKLTLHQYLGGILIVTAVAITSGHNPPKGVTRFQLLWGIFLGVLCKIIMAYGIVIAKEVIEVTPLIWATLIRIFAGTAGLVLIILFMPQRKAFFTVFKPTPQWKIIIPGSVLGAYLALLFWMGGFKYTEASIAAVLNQTSTIIAIILASLILKEVFTGRKLAAVVLAMIGIVLVMLFNNT